MGPYTVKNKTTSETNEKMQNGIITNGSLQNGVAASLKNEENNQQVNGSTSNGLSGNVENVKTSANAEQSESNNDKEVKLINESVQPQQQRVNGGQQRRLNNRQNQELLSKTNLYIRGLAQDCSDDFLYQLCKGYGKITSTKAIIDPATSLCKGYGFVDFEQPDSAQKAVEMLKSANIQAQMAKVGKTYQQEQDPTNLYFSNLPKDATETELESILKPYGSVVSTRVLRENSSGLSRGVGFARMESKEKCELVIARVNGKFMHELSGCTLNKSQCTEPLMIKFADGNANKKKNHPRMIARAFPNEQGIYQYEGYSSGSRHMSFQPQRNGPNRVMMPITSPQFVNGPHYMIMNHQYMLQPQHGSQGYPAPQMDNGHVATNIVHHGPAVPVQQFAQLHIAGPPPHVAYPIPPPPSGHMQVPPPFHMHPLQITTTQEDKKVANVQHTSSTQAPVVAVAQ